MVPQDVPFPKAVLFDMDGTLTVPTFDFPAIRRALGLPPGAPILEHIRLMSPGKQLEAEAVLRRSSLPDWSGDGFSVHQLTTLLQICAEGARQRN